MATCVMSMSVFISFQHSVWGIMLRHRGLERTLVAETSFLSIFLSSQPLGVQTTFLSPQGMMASLEPSVFCVGEIGREKKLGEEAYNTFPILIREWQGCAFRGGWPGRGTPVQNTQHPQGNVGTISIMPRSKWKCLPAVGMLLFMGLCHLLPKHTMPYCLSASGTGHALFIRTEY